MITRSNHRRVDSFRTNPKSGAKHAAPPCKATGNPNAGNTRKLPAPPARAGAHPPADREWREWRQELL